MNRIKSLLVIIGLIISGIVCAQEPKDLAHAVRLNNVDAAKVFIQEGHDINQQWGLYRLPLIHIAIEQRNDDMVQLLVESGADLSVKDDAHQTPLSLAAIYQNEPIITLLLDNGAKIEDTCGMGNTALHIAAQSAEKNIIGCLLWYGARQNKLDALLCGNALGLDPAVMAAQVKNEENANLLGNWDSINHAIETYQPIELRKWLEESSLPAIKRLEKREITGRF